MAIRSDSLRRLLVTLPIACAMILPLATSARAQGEAKDCAPGSWFCGDTTPPASGATGGLQPLPPDGAAKPPPPPPPVVVYQPAPTTVIVQSREAPPAYHYVPRQPPPKKEWGLNFHLGGLMLGKGHDQNAGMALVGLGLRFRPVPAFALEGDVDFAGGRDYNGFRRKETAVSFNGLLFLNPRSKTQVYFLGGIGWSGATAIDDRTGTDRAEYKYGYFGGQIGAGLEFRLSQVVALNVDLRGIIRGRMDQNSRERPEFVDANGRSTNTSGAGVFQGGLTFYW